MKKTISGADATKESIASDHNSVFTECSMLSISPHKNALVLQSLGMCLSLEKNYPANMKCKLLGIPYVFVIFLK